MVEGPERSKRFTLLACAALAAVAALAGVLAAPANAQDAATLQSRIESGRAEAQALAAEIDAGAAAIAQAQAQAVAAAKQEAEMSAVLEEGRSRLAELRARVAEAREALDRARSRLRDAVKLLSNRLVSIYKGADPDATVLLLDADGFNDLTTRIEYLRAIEDADAALVERVRSLRQEIETQLVTIEQASDEQESFNERLASARAEISGVRAGAEAKAARLDALRSGQAAALASLRGNIDSWTSQVAVLQASSTADAAAEVQSWFGDWAIPASIVMCESGGNYGAINSSSGAGGAYQILPSTWELYGGKGAPHEAPKSEQDRIAAQIWADSGSSAWVC